MMGQTIPDTWRSGANFVYTKNSTFGTGEAVVVTRSSGIKTFGVVQGYNSVDTCLSNQLQLYVDTILL